MKPYIKKQATYLLLPFYSVLNLTNNKFWFVAFFGIYAFIFITVPFIDRNHERRTRI